MRSTSIVGTSTTFTTTSHATPPHAGSTGLSATDAGMPLAIHMPAPVRAGQPCLGLGRFDALPSELTAAAIASQLKLEDRLVLGTTSRQLGRLLDEAAPGDPGVAHYYALRLAPRGTRDEFVARRRAIAAKSPDAQSLQAEFETIERNMVHRHDPFGFHSAAKMLMRLAQPAKAMRILQSCLKAVPDAAISHLLMAQAHWRLGAFDDAIACARLAGSLGVEFSTFALIARQDVAGALAAARDDYDADYHARLAAQFLTDPKGAIAKATNAPPRGHPFMNSLHRLRDAAAVAQHELVLDRVETFASGITFWAWILDELALPIYDAYRDHPRFQEVVEMVSPKPEVLRRVMLNVPPAYLGVDTPSDSNRD